MPIRHFESNEPSVVVTVAEAGVHSDAGCQLTAATDFRSVGQLSGVFSMVRAKLNPPLSKSLHKFQTFCWIEIARAGCSFFHSDACVQFAKPVQ